MRYKISEIKAVVHSVLAEAKSIEKNGRTLVCLKDHPALQLAPQKIYFYPDEESKERWKQYLRVGRNDASLKEHQRFVDAIDRYGDLLSISKKKQCRVEFPTLDGKGTYKISTGMEHLWVEVPEQGPDYRPDEGLPEDYYAL